MGFDVRPIFPPVGADLPRFSLFGGNVENKGNDRSGGVESPGYFDILYLDKDCLIISQNEPGGIFVNIRDNSQTVSSFFES